ncbi:MAG: dual specificity protein phosphatase family protein [Proteobacteria bacterium]|nr:dual specificity protein phosphatase family protein [Pseudomonadota bacterium]
MPVLGHKVTICGIPELPQHVGTGVTHVLSIIDTHEPRPAALDTYATIDHELIRFDDVVAEYPGYEACNIGHIEKVLAFGERAHARAGSHVLIHCHAGISRSQAAAAILMCQHAPGQEEAAFLRLLTLRKHGWPNTRMVEFADTLLKRDGALMRGLLAYRRALIAEKPHLSEIIRNIGRGNELP